MRSTVPKGAGNASLAEARGWYGDVSWGTRAKTGNKQDGPPGANRRAEAERIVTSRLGVDHPRKSIGDRAMTDAQRQTRSRAQRWHDVVAELTGLQGQYAAWFDTLPDNLRENATAEALQAICDIDLADLQVIEPARVLRKELTAIIPVDAAQQ
jgi:hypothetical protein